MTAGDRAPAAPRAAPGILRVHLIPGTDQLLGTRHCGAQHTALDPVELWDWLHAHPVGHEAQPDPDAAPDPQSAEPAPESATDEEHDDPRRVLTVR